MAARSLTATRSTTEVSAAKIAGRVLTWALLIVLAFIFIAPLWFMVVTSFKPNSLALRDMANFNAFVPRISSPEVPAPDGWTTFANYTALFGRLLIPRMLLNSVIICGGVVILQLITDSMAAYALARLRWRGQHVMLVVIISLIIIPFEAIMMPLLLVVNGFGWINSYQVQIIPFIASPLSIYLFYQFFLGFPREIEEAAQIDGASYFGTYRSIVVPSAGPVFATVAILTFLGIWSAYVWPIMVTRNVDFRPLLVGLAFFFDDRPQWGQIMAYATLVTVPVLIFFLVFQRWFVRSVTATGVKG